MADVKALTKRLERLKTLRAPHEQVWRDCFDHSFPIRGNGLQGTVLDAQQALDRKAQMVDSTATDAGRILAAAIMSGLTPANSRWFQLEVSGADDEGEMWLDEKGSQLHQEIHAATFDAAAYECCLDIVGAGWFALFVDIDRNKGGGFRFEQWALGGVYATTTQPGGAVDTVFRTYTLTASQAVTWAEQRTKQGVKTQVSAQVTKMAQDEPDSPVEMCHAIYPRSVYAVGGKLARNLPIASCHFEVQTKHECSESGFHEMPVIVPRWMVIPDSVYAVGPMFDVLPDVRMLNKLKTMDLANADLAISGMWIAEDDGVLNPRTIKVGARKVIVANSVESMKNLSSGGDWQLADARISQLQASIRKALMADQLQPQDGPAMTATEVHVRVNLIRQLLGPIYGRLQAEYLQPLIERCFALAYRAGLFGPAPESLAGRDFVVKYVSPLARAQKMEDVGAIERLNENLNAMATLGAVAPAAIAALDVIDFDENVRTLIEGLGVPLKNTRDKTQVAELRDARAKQQQQAQQAQQQQEMQSMAAEAATKQAAAA